MSLLNDHHGGKLTEEEIRKTASRFLANHGLAERGWVFRFDRAKRRAGCCNFNKKQISLAHSFCNVACDEEVKNTLLHEIAHALVGPGHRHNRVWRQKAQEIGCDAKVTHNLNFSEARYRVGCMQGCWEITRHRINRNWLKHRRCGKCGSDLGLYDSKAA